MVYNSLIMFTESRPVVKFRTLAIVAIIFVAGFVLGPAQLASATNANGLNQWARDGSLAFKVTSINCGKKTVTSDGGFQTDKAQGIFCVLYITIKNIGKQAQTPFDSTQFLYDMQGRQYSADTSADIDLNAGPIWQFTNLNPGLTISGTLWYDVPVGTRIASLQVHDSAFSNGATISLLNATFGAWTKDKVVDGMLAINLQTEELDTTCSAGVGNYDLTASSVVKVYGGNGQLLVSAPLGPSSKSTDQNAKGKKVQTCNFFTHIWVPFNQSKYTFKWNNSSLGKSVLSSALIHRMQSKHQTLSVVFSTS